MRSDAEKAGDDRSDLLARFSRVVADLAGGGLTFPPPFDFASSIALASNLDTGTMAQRIFDVTAGRDLQFSVQITACSPEHPGLSRQVLDTTVSSTQVLTALLEGLLEELNAQAQEN